MRKILLTTLLAISLITLWAKNSQLDSLLSVVWQMRNNNPKQAIETCKKAIYLADSLKDYYRLAKAYSFMGVLYRNLGYHSVAFSYYKQAINVALKHNITEQLGYAYNNIGNLYLYQNLPYKAIKYLLKADSIGKQIGNIDLRAYALQNIGRVYLESNKPDSALHYLFKALELRKQYASKHKQAVTYKYIADAYKLKGEYQKALEYYKITSDLADFSKDIDLYADYAYQLADLYLRMGNLSKAQYYANLSLAAAHRASSLFRLYRAYLIKAKIMAKAGKYDTAYYFMSKALSLKDSIYTNEVIKSIQSINITEQRLQKEAEIRLLEKDLEIKTIENKRKTSLLIFTVILLLIILGFSISSFYTNRKLKRISARLRQTNKTISEQNDELREQKERLQEQAEELRQLNLQLAEKDKEISQSISYAKHILTGLTGDASILKTFPFVQDYFIINKPRDIVGGDFYYIDRFKNFCVVVVADSTGHGVPGAFISIIGISIFKDIFLTVKPAQITAANILEIFRQKVNQMLRQSIGSDEGNEQSQLHCGIDAALVLFFPHQDRMDYSGAYSPLYLIINNEFKEIKGTKTTAGYSIKDLTFINHSFRISEIQKLYMFTDGIKDQLSADGQKFTSHRWKELIRQNHTLPMKEQKAIIIKTIESWRGSAPQTDDILVIGIEIKQQWRKA